MPARNAIISPLDLFMEARVQASGTLLSDAREVLNVRLDPLTVLLDGRGCLVDVAFHCGDGVTSKSRDFRRGRRCIIFLRRLHNHIITQPRQLIKHHRPPIQPLSRPQFPPFFHHALRKIH